MSNDSHIVIDKDYLVRINRLSDKMSLSKEFLENEIGNSLEVSNVDYIDKVYYIHDYYPKWKFDTTCGNAQILQYKSRESESVFQFITLEIEAAIDAMLKHINPKKPVHLVAVPTSKVGKKSVISDSIDVIISNLRKRYGLRGYQLINDSALIARIIDVEPAHLTGSSMRDPEIQKETIKVCGPISYDDYYIIIDDIVTTGSILRACYDLIQVRANHRYTLVVGRTTYESTKANRLRQQITKPCTEKDIRIDYDFQERSNISTYKDWISEICDELGETADEFWDWYDS